MALEEFDQDGVWAEAQGEALEETVLVVLEEVQGEMLQIQTSGVVDQLKKDLHCPYWWLWSYGLGNPG